MRIFQIHGLFRFSLVLWDICGISWPKLGNWLGVAQFPTTQSVDRGVACRSRLVYMGGVGNFTPCKQTLETKSFLKSQAWHPTGLRTLRFDLGKQTSSGVPWYGKWDSASQRERDGRHQRTGALSRASRLSFPGESASRLAGLQKRVLLKSEMESRMQFHWATAY